MKKYCYVCGKELSEHPSLDECKCHDEHIISNAIGGHLTSRDFFVNHVEVVYQKEIRHLQTYSHLLLYF